MKAEGGVLNGRGVQLPLLGLGQAEMMQCMPNHPSSPRVEKEQSVGGTASAPPSGLHLVRSGIWPVVCLDRSWGVVAAIVSFDLRLNSHSPFSL